MSSPGIELAARRAMDAKGGMSMEMDLLVESSIGRGTGVAVILHPAMARGRQSTSSLRAGPAQLSCASCSQSRKGWQRRKHVR